MKFKQRRHKLLPTLLLLTLLLLTAAPAFVHAQQTQKPPDDVIKVNTELVQTAVTVVNKDGHFVDGLERENFQLVIDGKPRPIALFERVTGGKGSDLPLTKPRSMSRVRCMLSADMCMSSMKKTIMRP